MNATYYKVDSRIGIHFKFNLKVLMFLWGINVTNVFVIYSVTFRKPFQNNEVSISTRQLRLFGLHFKLPGNSLQTRLR